MNKIDFVKRGYGRLGLLLYTFSLFLSTFRWVILVSIGANIDKIIVHYPSLTNDKLFRSYFE